MSSAYEGGGYDDNGGNGYNTSWNSSRGGGGGGSPYDAFEDRDSQRQDKPRPQVVKLDKALKLAEAWVNNMSASAADEMVERKFEGRPPRLGLGAKLTPRSKVAASADPVEKKLRAKLDAGKKRAARDLEELSASERNGEHSDDDEDGLESRTNAFVKKRPMAPATTLQAKKKGK